MMALLVSLAATTAPLTEPVAAAEFKVLVFGDSQGDTGPTYQALADTLNARECNCFP